MKDIEALRQKKLDTDEKLRLAKSALAAAKATAAATGRHLPNDQFFNLVAQVDFLTTLSQKTQAELARLKTTTRSEKFLRINDLFVDVARSQMDKETFYRFMSIAQDQFHSKEAA